MSSSIKNKQNIYELITNVESLLYNIQTSNNHKSAIRNNINEQLLNHLQKTKYNNDSKLIQQIQCDMNETKQLLKNNPDLILVKTDKTKRVVFMHKIDFDAKMCNLLNDKKKY